MPLDKGETHQVLAQEILRVHPIAVEVVRAPIEDDVLPLTKPIVGTSGRVYRELLIPKGTAVIIPTSGYNLYAQSHQATTSSKVPSCYFHDRNQDVWGPDAHQFRPERWFEMGEQVVSPVGVYGNLYGHAWCSGGAVPSSTN